MKCGLDLRQDVSGSCGAAVLREGLRGACAGQSRGRPSGQHAGAGAVRIVLLDAGAPVDEDRARTGKDVALATASGSIKKIYGSLYSALSFRISHSENEKFPRNFFQNECFSLEK